MNHDLERINTEFNFLLRENQVGCAGLWDTFFPEDIYDVVTKRIATQTAKNICAECPIRQQCLENALMNNASYGIWGGLTPAERNAI